MVTDVYVEPETCVRHKSTGDDQKGLDHIDGDELEYVIIVYPHETIDKGAVREAIPNSAAKILILVDAECRNCAQTGDKKILFTIPEERIVKMKDITSTAALCKRGTVFWMLGLIERAYKDFSAIYEDRVDCLWHMNSLGNIMRD